MFTIPFGLAIKQLRLRKKMSQRSLAAAMCITPGRLSRIESGKLTPTLREQSAARAALGNIRAFVAPPRLARTLLSNANRCMPKRKGYEPARDRPNYVRFRAAREKYPEVVGALLRRVEKRPDLEICNAIAHQLVAESAEEALFQLRLMEAGALPCQLAPAEVATVPGRLIDPVDRGDVSFRRVACLAFESDFYFFQVTLAGPDWQYRVDALRCKNSVWSVVEVDGHGHDSSTDSRRERQIGLPTARFNVESLVDLNIDFRKELG